MFKSCCYLAITIADCCHVCLWTQWPLEVIIVESSMKAIVSDISLMLMCNTVNHCEGNRNWLPMICHCIIVQIKTTCIFRQGRQLVGWLCVSHDTCISDTLRLLRLVPCTVWLNSACQPACALRRLVSIPVRSFKNYRRFPGVTKSFTGAGEGREWLAALVKPRGVRHAAPTHQSSTSSVHTQNMEILISLEA